ncbi:hypothetical protein FKM82_013936 [Ascaphus truei]
MMDGSPPLTTRLPVFLCPAHRSPPHGAAHHSPPHGAAHRSPAILTPTAGPPAEQPQGESGRIRSMLLHPLSAVRRRAAHRPVPATTADGGGR